MRKYESGRISIGYGARTVNTQIPQKTPITHTSFQATTYFIFYFYFLFIYFLLSNYVNDTVPKKNTMSMTTLETQ